MRTGFYPTEIPRISYRIHVLLLLWSSSSYFFFFFLSFFLSLIFYLGLTKKCKLREERNYDYKKLMKISDFPGIQVSKRCYSMPKCSMSVYLFPLIQFDLIYSSSFFPLFLLHHRFFFVLQPSGYLVRLPFYVLAPRDAHIVFSPTESPNWTRDNVYEIC